MSDGSGHDHTGTIAAGTIVYGKRKPAVKLRAPAQSPPSRWAAGSTSPAGR